MARPQSWTRVIDQDNETCYWVAPDGSKHAGTPEENREVATQLLEMRARGEAINTQHRKELS